MSVISPLLPFKMRAQIALVHHSRFTCLEREPVHDIEIVSTCKSNNHSKVKERKSVRKQLSLGPVYQEQNSKTAPYNRLPRLLSGLSRGADIKGAHRKKAL